jgi:pimeloyl-ACP methyl ester carboxylesterase
MYSLDIGTGVTDMTPEQILTFVATLLSGPETTGFTTLKEGGFDERYPVTIEACPAPVPLLDIEGQTVICGEVNVPENYEKTDSRTIPLKFSVMKAHSESPQKDALVYLHGGPGGMAVPDISGLSQLFARFRADRDIVVFDQRASGISDATVTCFNTLGENVFALAGKEETVGNPVKLCLDELKADGVDLAAYNTTSNAHDVRAIMFTLGYPEYNAYGASYGTLLGQELMRSQPEGLRAIILDSIAPTFARSYDGNTLTIEKAIGSVVDRCMEQESCKEAYPTLEADVRGLGDYLKENPIAATATRPEINLETVRELWGQRNKRQLLKIDRFLPKILTEWSKGESTTWDLYKAGALTPKPSSSSIVAAFSGKVDPARLTAGYSIALQAEQLGSLNKSLESLMSLLAFHNTHPPEASSLEGRLDSLLSELAVKLEQDQMLALGKEYTKFVATVPSRDDLSNWVEKYFKDEELKRLQVIIGAMTEDDLKAFQARAEKDTGKYYSNLANGYFDLSVYACQEAVPFNSREGWQAVQETYRFPWVEDGELEDFYTLCENYDQVDRPGFHDPVVSDIPTLAMQGLADTQTDNDAATRVARYLKNVQVVTADQAGHGVLLASQCARDIAATFINYPDRPVDMSCLENDKVEFVTE